MMYRHGFSFFLFFFHEIEWNRPSSVPRKSFRGLSLSLSIETVAIVRRAPMYSPRGSPSSTTHPPTSSTPLVISLPALLPANQRSVAFPPIGKYTRVEANACASTANSSSLPFPVFPSPVHFSKWKTTRSRTGRGREGGREAKFTIGRS